MRNFVGWLRNRGRRRWILALLGAGVAGWLVLYLFPGRGQGTMLELTALGGDGRFAEEVTIPSHWSQTGGLEPGAVIRVPLVLAVRNLGKRPAPPTRLELSLPTRYRLSRSNGQPLPAEFVPGTPLVRYRLSVPAMRAGAGTIAGYLPVLDTVWLEPIIPSFYCIALSDSVPDFIPSPPAPVEAIARVRIFYSFAGDELGQRQTGLLAVQLDPTLLKLEAPAPPPVFPTEYHRGVAPRPFISELFYKGSRRAYCGDPQDPIEIMSTLWETPAGGRLFVLDYGGAPRKYLYDLNRDSIVELELWDASGSGHFDARRQARLPIPEFLMPPTGPPPMDGSIFAAYTPAQLLALDRHGRAITQPYQFRTRPPEKEPRTNRFRPGVIGGDEEDERIAAGSGTRYWVDPATTSGGAPSFLPPAVQTAPSTGFQHTAPAPAGPPTLGRPLTRPSTPTVAPTEREPQPPRRGGEPAARPPAQQPAQPPTQQPPERPTPAPKPAPSKPTSTGPKVLGRPLDSIPKPARPDTTGR
jgi:hypothetical protein